MTHEQFITLETAKLAKQAGFYWECNERYSEGHDTNDSAPLYISPRDNWNQDADLYSAPTQAVLQRWLREVKNIWVSVTCDSAGENKQIHIKACLMPLYKRQQRILSCISI